MIDENCISDEYMYSKNIKIKTGFKKVTTLDNAQNENIMGSGRYSRNFSYCIIIY